MKRTSFFGLGLIALAGMLSGCGGSGVALVTSMPTAGIYRGTMSLPYFRITTQQVGASVKDLTHFAVYSQVGSFVASGATATAESNGLVASGPFTSQFSNGMLTFSLTSSGNTDATGSISVSTNPSLSNQSLTPIVGLFSGYYYIYGPSGLAGFGTVYLASIMPGSFSLITDVAFTGSFGSNHALNNATLISGGQALSQTTSQYSFDGTTLTFRFDQLPISPETEWVVLTKS